VRGHSHSTRSLCWSLCLAMDPGDLFFQYLIHWWSFCIAKQFDATATTMQTTVHISEWWQGNLASSCGFLYSYSREFRRCWNIYKKSCDFACYRSEESELTNQEVLIRDLLRLEGVFSQYIQNSYSKGARIWLVSPRAGGTSLSFC